MRRFLPAICMAVAYVLALPVSANGEPVIVELKDFKFHPRELTVKAGTTVRWVNVEKRQYHSVWFRELGDPEAEYFFPEEFVERTFDTPGTYPYICEPHETSDDMTGVVHVVE